jgi:hypothetical protein
MTSQKIAIALAGLFLFLGAQMQPAHAQVAANKPTPLPAGLEITLQPGFTYIPRQGFDSIVGGIEKKDGLKISFEMGAIPPPGAPRFGGSFANYATRVPEKDRQWLKEMDAGGRKVHVAYGNDQMLIVTSATEKEGVNFHATAKTPEEIADVLLMVLSLAPQKPKAP